MYLDFNTVPEEAFDVDVCIIGSGAAGFACAISFLETGLHVLVAEGGQQQYDEPTAALQQATVSNHPHQGIREARERIIGGTTTKWGGQALPFLEEDFQVRPHVEQSGWPFGKAELEPYYHKAEAILGTDASVPADYNPWQERNIKLPDFTDDTLTPIVTKWCKVPNFAVQHGAKLASSPRVHLLYNANVVEAVPTTSRQSVRELRLRSLQGKRGTIRARYVIAAGGAIETVRLFLNSTQFGAAGLGNTHQLVGRYFQDHVAAVVGQVLPTSRDSLQAVFGTFYKNGFKYLPRLQLSTRRAAQLHLLHASVQLLYVSDRGSTLELAKGVYKSIRQRQLPSLRALRSLLSPASLLKVARVVTRWKLKQRGSFPASGPIWLEVHSEQAPIAESYVTLSPDTDALHVRRVRLHWTIADSTVATIRETATLLKAEFERTGLGQVQLEPWVTSPDAAFQPLLKDAYHQAGGLRMATDPAEGVVDASCKVFGIDNLYVASSAVFPTSSFSNPTMTIIALAIRVSEEIVRQAAHNKVSAQPNLVAV